MLTHPVYPVPPALSPIGQRAAARAGASLGVKQKNAICAFKRSVVEYPFTHTWRCLMSQDIIAALYGRVSNKEKQGDNFSIPTQLDRMREWVVSQQWQVGYELSETDSAFLEGLSRSELNKVLDLARKGKIQALVFFSPDRFTRDIADGVILRRELKRAGVKLYCYYPQPHEITSDMEIMNILMDWQSQQYVEKMREASMRGVAGKVEAGIFSQGRPPYGYRLEGKRWESHLVIVEEERVIIVRMFTLYYYGTGAAKIAQIFNDEHIPAPLGGLWDGYIIRNLLKKPVYAGTWYAYTYKQVSKNKVIKRPMSERKAIAVPAMISLSMWEQIQEQLRSRHLGRNDNNQYLMSCRTRCICGAANFCQTSSNGVTKRKYAYYRCGAHQSRHLNTRSCDRPQFPVPNVDDTVWQFALELIRDPQKLLQGYRDMQVENEQEGQRLASQVESLTEQIREQREELTDLQQQREKSQSKTVKAMLDERIEIIGLAIDEMQERLDILLDKRQDEPYTDEQIAVIVSEISALRDMYEALDTIDEEADLDAKKELIKILNLKATLRVDEQGQRWVDIHWLRRAYPEKLCEQKVIRGRP
jgi:site-specific DNA recombinase